MGMETIAVILLAVLIAAVLLLAWSIRRGPGGRAAELDRFEAVRAELGGTLSSNLKSVDDRIANMASLVNSQLASVTSQLQASTGQINTRMDSAARMVGDLNLTLGELSRATERVFDVGRDISRLQDILRAPKLRGGLGELFLEDLLSQCLPSKYYSMQHTFSSGVRVDAVIRLSGGLVPVDSKFPLENFRRIIECDGDEKKTARRRFVSDLKKHIDAIASSYILPSEGTLNFALMYIPAENVYYETILKDSPDGDAVSSYAFSKKVIPVSPNSFYAYLQTILLGLRGMEVDRDAERILAGIERLRGGFNAFSTDFSTLGRHLTNAAQKYDDAVRRLDHLGYALEGMAGEAGTYGPDRLPPEGAPRETVPADSLVDDPRSSTPGKA